MTFRAKAISRPNATGTGVRWVTTAHPTFLPARAQTQVATIPSKESVMPLNPLYLGSVTKDTKEPYSHDPDDVQGLRVTPNP